MAGPDDTAAPAPSLSSIFFANPTTPQQQQLSYPALLMRQQIAMRLLGQRHPYPKNIGEGIANLGESLGERRMMQDLAAKEQAYSAGLGALPAPGSKFLPGGIPAPAAPPPRAVIPPRVTAPSPPAASGATGDFVPDGGTSTTADATDETDAGRNNIALAMYPGTAGGVPSPNPTDTEAGSPPVTGPGGQSANAVSGEVRPEMQPYLTALAGGETAGSRDPYSATGTVTRNGDRAYGKYQIMGANIPQWTQAALGQSMTPDEFLADPEAQDLTAQHRFGSYVDKYGPQGAARAWYAGEGGMNNLNATDINQRINVGQYGQQFLNRLNGGGQMQVASLDPTMAFAARAPTEAADNPPITTDIAPAPVRLAGDVPTPSPRPGSAPAGVPDPYGKLAPLPSSPTPAAAVDAGKPVPPARAPLEPEELYAQRLLMTHPGDPNYAAYAAAVAAPGTDRRNAINAQNDAVYKADLGRWEASAKAIDEAGMPKAQLELAQAQRKAAIENRLGGRTVEDFVKDFKTEHTDATKMIGSITNMKEAESAVRAGAITGYGSNARLQADKLQAWLLNNGKSGNAAAQTELLKANLDATISFALSKIQPGDTRVTEGDVMMARGLSGSPEMQKEAILKIIDLSKQMAYDRINAFEERRHQKVGGTPLEGDFATTMAPVASPDSVKTLIEHKDDPNYVAHFNTSFGPGTARLTIDRARRAAEAADRTRREAGAARR
jgi:hypothetical protein